MPHPPLRFVFTTLISLSTCSQLTTMAEMIRIVRYITPRGRDYFGEWFDDQPTEVRARIQARLDRIEVGNFGDHRLLKGGIVELRLDFGPGYRVYFGRDAQMLVILLAAGTKRRQSRDIERARRHWQQYLEEK